MVSEVVEATAVASIYRSDLMTVTGLRAKGFVDVEEVADVGACLKVPSASFQAKWRNELAKSGHVCVDGADFVLVRLAVDLALMRRANTLILPKPTPEPAAADVKGNEKKVTETQEKQEIPVLGSKPRGGKKGVSWTAEDEQRLKKRWAETSGSAEKKAEALAAEFSGRTVLSLVLKHAKLLRAEKKAQAKQPQENSTAVDQSKQVPASSTIELPKGKTFIGLGAGAVTPVYAPFEQVWAASADLEAKDLKARAQDFYNAATKASLPGPVVGSVIACFEELDAYRVAFEGQIGDLQTIAQGLTGSVEKLSKLASKHVHARGSGRPCVPVEV